MAASQPEIDIRKMSIHRLFGIRVKEELYLHGRTTTFGPRLQQMKTEVYTRINEKLSLTPVTHVSFTEPGLVT